MRKLVAGWLLRAVQKLYPTDTKAARAVHERIGQVAEAMMGDL